MSGDPATGNTHLSTAKVTQRPDTLPIEAGLEAIQSTPAGPRAKATTEAPCEAHPDLRLILLKKSDAEEAEKAKAHRFPRAFWVGLIFMLVYGCLGAVATFADAAPAHLSSVGWTVIIWPFASVVFAVVFGISVVIIGALPGFRRPAVPIVAVFTLMATLFAMAVRARILRGTVPTLAALWELGHMPLMVSVFMAPALAVVLSGVVLVGRWLMSWTGRSPEDLDHSVEAARPALAESRHSDDIQVKPEDFS
jgi:hypothetical protein